MRQVQYPSFAICARLRIRWCLYCNFVREKSYIREGSLKETRVYADQTPVIIQSEIFLAKVGEGRTIHAYSREQIVFSQGDPADAVFYIQKGKVKVTVVSEQGKEAVVAIFGTNEFFGEGCLAGQPQRIATATTMTDSDIVRLEKRLLSA